MMNGKDFTIYWHMFRIYCSVHLTKLVTATACSSDFALTMYMFADTYVTINKIFLHKFTQSNHRKDKKVA